MTHKKDQKNSEVSHFKLLENKYDTMGNKVDDMICKTQEN